jgi:hypothetical protein
MEIEKGESEEIPWSIRWTERVSALNQHLSDYPPRSAARSGVCHNPRFASGGGQVKTLVGKRESVLLCSINAQLRLCYSRRSFASSAANRG